jgi:hypothetical protein
VVSLLDVSVLVALFHEGHVHHQVAHDWFADHGAAGWASCPVTENGLLRILGNPKRVDHHIALPRLVALLTTFCGQSKHEHWWDDISLQDSRLFNVAAMRGHQQITDVYLLGLAVKRRGRFVTFDTGVPLQAVKGARRESLEVLASAE